MLRFLLALTGFASAGLISTWLSKMPPAPMGYLTSPPMFKSGLTFCRHWAERSTPMQTLSMPLTAPGLSNSANSITRRDAWRGARSNSWRELSGLVVKATGLGSSSKYRLTFRALA